MSDHIDRAAEVLHKAWIDRCGVTAPTRDHVDVFIRALDSAGLLVTPEHDAAVAAEWADHFEVRQGAVGSERLTVESMIAALRGPRPFGCEAGESDAGA